MFQDNVTGVSWYYQLGGKLYQIESIKQLAFINLNGKINNYEKILCEYIQCRYSENINRRQDEFYNSPLFNPFALLGWMITKMHTVWPPSEDPYMQAYITMHFADSIADMCRISGILPNFYKN